jgi:hypothetical protein
MQSLLSIVISLIIIGIALKLALKVTGCLVKIVIFAVALYLIANALNFGFGIFKFLL